jgi:hypothetical protein
MVVVVNQHKNLLILTTSSRPYLAGRYFALNRPHQPNGPNPNRSPPLPEQNLLWICFVAASRILKFFLFFYLFFNFLILAYKNNSKTP